MTVRSEQPTQSSSPQQREQALVDAARHQVEAAAAAYDPQATAAAMRSPTTNDRAELPTADAFAGYRITRKIYGGGQGVVYQAIQVSTGQRVALKVMRAGPFADPRNRARLDRCVHILGELNHTGIVRIIDSGQTADALFYVMDYIPGHALGEWLEMRLRSSVADPTRERSTGPLSRRRQSQASSRREHAEIEQTVRLFIKLCDALNAAHVKGVIHRDIKPGNVLIDGSGNPHILDFDLAKIVIGELDPQGRFAEVTQTGEFLGSLRWASPEQVLRVPGRIDTRTDVYAIGVLLYEALTGQSPYPVLGTRRDLEDHILRTEPSPPSRLRRKIPDDLDTIVLKCLAKPPERRYQSAGTVADDLRSYLAGAPISARRDNTWYLLRKLARRHALATTVLAATIVTLLSATSISVYFYRQAAQAARDRSDIANEALLRAQMAEAAGRTSLDATSRLSLGWFLNEWRQGYIQRAKQIRDQLPPNCPEVLAMQFLLDQTQSDERFLAQTPASAAALAYFVIGERHLTNRRADDALRAFRSCVALPAKESDEWYQQSAAARLLELEESQNAPTPGALQP